MNLLAYSLKYKGIRIVLANKVFNICIVMQRIETLLISLINVRVKKFMSTCKQCNRIIVKIDLSIYAESFAWLCFSGFNTITVQKWLMYIMSLNILKNWGRKTKS